MNAPFADAVHAIFRRGISVRERVEAGEPIPWAEEREAFKRLLAGLGNVAGEDGLVFDFSEHHSPEERERLRHATEHFALTCWIEEWFILHTPLAQRWREQTLEAELHHSEDGGAKFWDEARYAETRGDLAALEVMHLCVALGFRGKRRDPSEPLQAWGARVRSRLEPTPNGWPKPSGLEPTTCPTKHAEDARLHRLAFSLLATTALMLPMFAMLAWRLWKP